MPGMVEAHLKILKNASKMTNLYLERLAIGKQEWDATNQQQTQAEDDASNLLLYGNTEDIAEEKENQKTVGTLVVDMVVGKVRNHESGACCCISIERHVMVNSGQEMWKNATLLSFCGTQLVYLR
ncbi:hypothetical protein ACTXT7_005422 [Hymenolepis weldensis]